MNIVPLTEEDLPFLIEVRNECKDLLHNNDTFCLMDAEKWYTELPANHKYYLITEPGLRIGYFRVETRIGAYIDSDIKIATIGADIHKDFRGKGLAVPAYELMFKLLKKQDVGFMELHVLGTNTVAYNLYRKLGFVMQTINKMSEIKRDGRLIPSIRMGKWLE